jgi:uncharacterized protein YjcR
MEPRTPTLAQELLSRSTGRSTADLLRELYVERRYSQQEIADALGMSRSTVREWLRRDGISRADRLPVELEATA